MGKLLRWGAISPTSMDAKTKKEIQKKLDEERDSLEKQLAAFTHRSAKNADDFNAEFPQIGDKEDENAAEVEQYSTNLSLERTLESALRDVKKSLERLKNGDYGTCKYCSKEIDPKRLLARPTSSACIDCKKRLTREA